MTNRLGNALSPYLLQHKDNPVHWWPWGPEALAEARRLDRPILLSVGYAACHWCHVMAHESFEDQVTADLMNRHFINIKVDREERPDIDQVYMSALQALGEQGGWPLTMFLDSDAKPVWGGTYFPPAARFGRPGFPDVLKEIARIWDEDRDRIHSNRDLLVQHLTAAPASRDHDRPAALDTQLLDNAVATLFDLMDPEHGGIRGAPKFPQTSLLETLWRAGTRNDDDAYRNIVINTLTNICQGGIYDHLGGGFCRYSVDERWLVPHFEKMLYDNAQLVDLLALVYHATGSDLFRLRIEETVAWLLDDMRQTGGGFAASRDADSEGEEGRYYVWTETDLASILSPDDARMFAAVYDIQPDGNWEGRSIPNRLQSGPLGATDTEARLTSIRTTLLEHRSTRIPPSLDTKILADWNGLTIAALTRAGVLLERPNWIEAARDGYSFVTESMMTGGRLAHAWRDGRATYPGLASDWANMIRAALRLYDATAEASYLHDAIAWTERVNQHHLVDAGGHYFLSADDVEDLFLRPRANTDEATPAATSVMADNLVHLWHLTGTDDYRAAADRIFAAAGSRVAANVYNTASLLNAFDFRLAAVAAVIISPDASTSHGLVASVRSAWTPNLIVSVHDRALAVAPSHPAYGKTVVDGVPTLYLCREGSCSQPITEPSQVHGAIATMTYPPS